MNYSYYDQSQAQDASQFFTLKDLIGSFWRGRWIIVACVAIALVGAAVYLAAARPTYTTTARILIDPRQIDPLSTSVDGRGYSDLLVVDSQIEIMRSRALAERAMENLKLFDQQARPDDSLIGAVQQWIQALIAPEQASSADDTILRQERINNFARRISVERVRLTYAIAISYSHPDPRFAADAANAIATAYLEDQLAAQFNSVNRSREWVDAQLSKLKANLDQAKIEADRFRAENNLVETQDRTDMSVAQLKVLADKLGAAKADAAQAEALMNGMNAIVSSGDPNQALPDVINSRVISDLRQSYAQLESRAAEIKAKQGPQHQVYIDAVNQLDRIKQQMLDEFARIGDSYKNAYQVAVANQNAIQAQIDTINGQIASGSEASVKLAELDRRVASTQTVYDNLLDSSNRLAQQESVPITEARIVDAAEVPTTPSAPQRRLTLLLALFGGLVAGFGIVAIRTTTDDRIWTQGALERLTERQCIGVIPRLRIPATGRSSSVFSVASDKLGISGKRTNQIHPIVLQPFTRALSATFSPQIETMRSINMFLKAQSERSQAEGRSFGRQGTQVISFCSSLPGEGKTSVSTLYATYLAQSGVQVLLVDLDYRRPGLTRLLAPNVKTGIFDLPEFSGTKGQTGQESGAPAPTFESIRRVGVDGLLELLPGCTEKSQINLMEEKLDDVVETIVSRYAGQVRAIIIDLPPVLSLPDAQTLVKHLDAIFLVSEWGKTDKSTIKAAMLHAPEFFERVSRTILNKARTDVMQTYGTAEARNAGYYYK